MSNDNVTAAEGLVVDKDGDVEAADAARRAQIKDDLKPARQRVKDAQKHDAEASDKDTRQRVKDAERHLAAIEKETAK